MSNTSLADIAMAGLVGSHMTIRAIVNHLKKNPEDTPRVIKQIDVAISSAETSLENLVAVTGGGETAKTTPAPLALPGPLHENVATEKAKKKTSARRTGKLPAHLSVPHVCPGKRFGCTKVTYGNSHKIHEQACKFLKKGLAAEKKIGVKAAASGKKTSAKKKAAA